MKSLRFKVKYGRWSAEILLHSNETLEELANVIIEAVGFKMDHCYGFYDNTNRYYKSTESYSLFVDLEQGGDDGDTGVKSTEISEVFQPGKKMQFLFDYGDEWNFLVSCTKEEDCPPSKYPKLISTKGKPPKQYPTCGDE